MNPVETERALRQFLTGELGVPSGMLDADAPLLDGGLIDSLGIISLVAFCEEELGCQVPPEDIAPEAFHSLDALTEAVGRWQQVAPA